MKKYDVLKGYSIILLSAIIVFVFIPITLWINHKDSENLKNREKEVYGLITNIKGLKGNDVVFEYHINNQKIKKTKSAPSNHTLKIGNKLLLLYDTLDYENSIVIWDKIIMNK